MQAVLFVAWQLEVALVFERRIWPKARQNASTNSITFEHVVMGLDSKCITTHDPDWTQNGVTLGTEGLHPFRHGRS